MQKERILAETPAARNSNASNDTTMKFHCRTRHFAVTGLVVVAMAAHLCSAVLVQPFNYMLDDSQMVGTADGGSLSPFFNDQSGASESGADKDIVSIIGDSLARLRYARMLDNQQQQDDGSAESTHLSPEMAELIQSEQQPNQGKEGEQSLGSSVASMLLNVAQAAAAQASEQEQQAAAGSEQVSASQPSGRSESPSQADTAARSGSSTNSQPSSKSELKQSGPTQWFNPKETIPVLKISSMATPSKYKKVYFRSEKKLVDGAFHSQPSEQEEKKSSLAKPFNSAGPQRRSSRGTSSSVAPPGILQDGIIDFLKKFRDVYMQTRPAGSSSSSASSLSSVVTAAASSPLAALMAPSSSGSSRPNLSSALSAASSMVNSAAMVAQAAGSGSGPSSSSSGAGSAAVGASGASASRPLTAQSYVSFWSKTFPTWVRKMLKQMRRRSLYNSSKRQQHQQGHHSSSLGHATQAAASNAVASVVESAVSSSNGGSSSTAASSSS